MTDLIDGLNEQEWKFMHTPLGQLDEAEKRVAIAIADKRAKFIYEDNARYREANPVKAIMFDPADAVDPLFTCDDTP